MLKSVAHGTYKLLVTALAVSALVLAGVMPAQAQEPDNVLHVFLAAGQSNMSGRGLPHNNTDDPADSRIFQYGAKVQSFRAATVPLDMHDYATGLSPATTFVREYLRTQPANVGVLIIPAAHGSTGFKNASDTLGSATTHTWSVGAASAPEYDLPTLAVSQTLAGVSAARAAGYGVELKGVLWHQGENNASLSTSGYSTRLDGLIAFFRSRLEAPNLPVVVGRMAPEGIAEDPIRSNVDRSHHETPSRVVHTGFAASMTGAVNTGDTIHFSRTGIEFLGKTYLSGYAHAAAAIVDTGSLSASVPTISGAASVGSLLTANPGAWGPAPVTLTYQWYRAGSAISGATRAAYMPSPDDMGESLTVQVSGSKTGYPAVARTSTDTAPIAEGSLAAPMPTVTGTARVGSVLTAAPGSWGPNPVNLAYQWRRSGTAITGATAAT